MPRARQSRSVGLKGRHLLNGLDVRSTDEVFGIAYSILTWSGVFKGVSISPSSWAKTISKGIEDGHAMTFIIDQANNEFATTGMGDKWVFDDELDLDEDYWARTTQNATTDVYYTAGAGLVEKFKEVQEELKNTKATYAIITPNTPLTPRYENCVSSSHYVVYKMGLGYWASTKGWWIPSMRNYLTWAATKASSWKYKRFDSCNTHFPEDFFN